MSSEERSPKRQRLSSYSPASTPTETKSTPAFVQHPNTPPPSVHMSPSWNSQTLPGLGMVGNGNAGGVNFPTPPSPAAAYQSQSVAQSVGSEGGSAQQTPAADAEKHDAEMAERDAASGRGEGDGDVSMAEDSEHRRTNHERTGEGEDTVSPSPGAVGLFFLPSEPVAYSQPHPSQNLIELYSLQRIQGSVARKDPVTGEKINKLRKSYEGKVKDLGLEGRNKAKHNLKELENLLHPEWDLSVPDGRTYFEAAREHVDFSERGAEDMLGMLGSAFSGIKPGRLPRAEDNQWKNALGLDDSSLSKAGGAPAASALPPKMAANSFLSKTSPATAVQRSAPASPRGMVTGAGSGGGVTRPDRAGKKRRYDDASFEGYDEDGYSTGDGGSRRGSMSKRQKRKDFPNSTSTSPPFSANSGGSSAVGVRSS